MDEWVLGVSGGGGDTDVGVGGGGDGSEVDWLACWYSKW